MKVRLLENLQVQTTLLKTSGEKDLQMVWAEVYVPGLPDSQGDWMTADEIRAMAYRYMSSDRLHKVDVNHNNVCIQASIIESFIAREDDQIFLPGSWVVGMHVNDPNVWALIKKGKLNGFSMEALVTTKEGEVDFDIPNEVKGKTFEADNHTHTFRAFYDEEGKFLGGETDLVDGHRHRIVRGTLTEEARGHTHRFAAIDFIRKPAVL